MMSRPSAVVLIIVDGLSDAEPKSTLQIASTPILDEAAKRGSMGLIDPVQPGLACGSDTAHLSLFGYDPHRYYRGRGAFEALGAGLSMFPGDIAFKCNFARVDPTTRIVSSRCAHSKMHATAARLVSTLEDKFVTVPGFSEVKVRFLHTGDHRVVVSLRPSHTNMMSDKVVGTDPLQDGLPIRVAIAKKKGYAPAEYTANVINALSVAIEEFLTTCRGNFLDDEPEDQPLTNVLLLRGPASRVSVQPFSERHGLNTFLIAPCKIIAGVGISVGIEILKVDGATGGFDTNLRKKATACVDSLMKTDEYNGNNYIYQLGIIHIKAADEAAHEQNVTQKVFWLEKIDDMIKHLLCELCQRNRSDIVFAITGDHSSPPAYGDHTCEPVPLLFSDVFNPDTFETVSKYIRSDRSNAFDEISAGENGSLGRFPGIQLMEIIKTLLHKPG